MGVKVALYLQTATTHRVNRKNKARLPHEQVAKQQGQYLAKLLKAGYKPGADGVPAGMEPFNYAHKGNLAYIGAPLCYAGLQ